MFSGIYSILIKGLKVFEERFRRGPLDNVRELERFVSTRSAYIAQTSLYGYLKTRMGTRFRSLFEDEVFSQSIRQSSAKLFVSCAADLSIYALALILKARPDLAGDANAFGAGLYRRAIEQALADEPLKPDIDGAVNEFEKRLATTDWQAAAEGENAFRGSADDLIRFAPVIDEFKDLDREIVTNSIRFRWRDVREQLRKRLVTDGFAFSDESAE